MEPGAGRVVRVGDKDNARALGNGSGHGIEVVAEAQCRHLYRFGGTGQCHQRVHREGVFGKDDLVTGCQPATRDQFEHIVGAVAEGDLGAAHAEFFCQRSFQAEAGAVRVAVQVVEGVTCGLQRLVAGTKRIFVAGQLDDIADAELALELFNRLAGLVGLQLLHARVGQLDEITTHVTAPPVVFLVGAAVRPRFRDGTVAPTGLLSGTSRGSGCRGPRP